jgi:hypothetical protein
MSNPVVPGRLSFEEDINILLEELVLAGKWDRPSILLAVHKSKFGQDKAQAELQERLTGLGQDVKRIKVDPEHSDVPHLTQALSSGARKPIYFVSNLDWGGGLDRKDAYRALNIYREIFVDHRLRLVLWLTINEAATLARLAPDFWAFRHRVVEFTGQRIPKQVHLPAGVMLWDVQNTVDPFDTLEARIAVREELLAKLPHNPEARSSRVDLLYNLGYLYWTGGDAAKAAQQLTAGLNLTGGELGDRARTALLNGLAILAYEAEDYGRTDELLRQALRDDPENAVLLVNLAAASNALGRNQEAALLSKKALKSAERDSQIWSSAGYIDIAMGKFDDAIACFNTAVDRAPRVAAHHLALALCYDLVERTEDTVRQLQLARTLAPDPMLISIDIYEAALAGDTAKSLELASAAIRTDRLSIYDLRRDPGLSLLVDPAQLEALMP